MDSRYAYAVGYVRALENRMVSRRTFERISGAEDENSFLRAANSAGYQGGTPYEFEKAADGRRRDAVLLSKKLMADASLREILGLRYDFYNAAVLLAAKNSGGGEPLLYEDEGNTGLAELKKAVGGQSFLGVPEYIASALAAAEEEFRVSGKISFAEMSMDRSYFNSLNALSSAAGNGYMEEQARTATDLFNIRAFFRAAREGAGDEAENKIFTGGGKIPAGFFLRSLRNPEEAEWRGFSEYDSVFEFGRACLKEGGTFAPVEAEADRIILRKAEAAARIVMGPEPVHAYFLKINHEIKTLRSILAGIRTRAPEEMLRERTVFLS